MSFNFLKISCKFLVNFLVNEKERWNGLLFTARAFVHDQSQKNPVSASAMLTGKFLQIRKVFATSSLLAEEFPDTLQYKISR